ncbi:hypothetical protein LOTGIDRAFT_237923 [Lottia gigantea]|uniref:Cytoplasmic tRNA 2-thiolation protein 2 n=1 Tax=Lottia gigantea TaxID=225164 RepID=V4CK50_LOTGI|nr:hypothetical protein LOTGIDRAFT_237923 [Lottia gigantea]ESP02605.1 hypothetical protein LOTGIDRAFT_237923 [Lottia gigantea]
MCSVGDDGDAVANVREKLSCLGRKCMKCENDAFIITRMNDPFCQECFTVYVVHKFRSAIGKSKIVRDGDQVLLMYSGGQASTALLHLVIEGLSERAHKKLRFKPVILHIDESAVLGMTDEKRQENLSEVLKIMKKTGFPYYLSSIEQALDLSIEPKRELFKHMETTEDIYKRQEEKITSLQSLLSSIKTLTAREDFIKNLRNQLMLSISGQLGYSKIMTGDTNSRLAVNILNHVAQGRGAQVAYSTGFCDNRYKDIVILRPIRDLSIKEVAVYNQMNKLDSVFIPTLSTKAPSISSIEKLTEKFVTGLQADYLSTVSNIVRTGEKLGVSDEEINNESCIFCQSSIDTNVGPASALVAVEFSEKLSKEGRQATSSTDTISDRRNEIKKKLCYGCRVTLSEIDDIHQLPEFIKTNTLDQNRLKMKNEIEEYLLQPDDN